MIKYFTIEDLLKHYLQKKFHILAKMNGRFASESGRSKTEWRPPSTVNCSSCNEFTHFYVHGFIIGDCTIYNGIVI